MTNLEKLYEMNRQLEEQLSDIKHSQSELAKEIETRKKVLWEEMFDDIFSLSKYSKTLDTGFTIHKGETLGFDIRDNCIVVISWSHEYENKKRPEPYLDTFYFPMYRDKPFDAEGSHFAYAMEYLVKVAENWKETKEEMIRRLEEKLERDMKKKIDNAIDKQKQLEDELRAFS